VNLKFTFMIFCCARDIYALLYFTNDKIMLRAALVVTALAVMMSFAIPAVYATTYYGPSFITPTSIPPGSPIPITLTTGSGSTFVSPPTGSGLKCNAGTCTFLLQACTNSSAFYYLIHQITVTDPNKNGYMLGSALTSGLYWPSALGGSGSGTAVPPQADALNVTTGDSFTLIFGQGAGGQTFTSVLGNPPNDVSPAGPYYWWTIAGNTYGSGLRLDTTGASINPTTTHGMYTVDIEGVVECGHGVFFDQGITLFFDSGITVTTPQFPIGFGLAAAIGLVGLVLVKTRSGKQIPTISNSSI
jgi:hypothetical protein